MSGRYLLVTFCSQTTSPLFAGGLFDLDGANWRWLPLEELGIAQAGNGGLCGACVVADQIVVATQTMPPRVIRYDPRTDRITASRILDGCSDLHSMVWRDGILYVVSTGTNEIYALSLDHDGFGEPQLWWQYPGVAYGRDLVHLNGLTPTPEGLVASCFGPRQQTGSWGTEGAVFRLEPFEVISGGLSHPHSPLCCGDRLFVSESRRHRVLALHRNASGQWESEQAIEVGGYARGLAYRDGELVVGLSAERQISRSKGTRNAVADSIPGAAIVCVDVATHTITSRRELAGFGEEIYDLANLDDPGPLPAAMEGLVRRVVNVQSLAIAKAAELEASIRLLALDYAREHCTAEGLAVQLEAEQAASDRLKQLLAAEQAETERLRERQEVEQAETERLARELSIITESRLWRAGELVRRLAGRKRDVRGSDHSEM